MKNKMPIINEGGRAIKLSMKTPFIFKSFGKPDCILESMIKKQGLTKTEDNKARIYFLIRVNMQIETRPALVNINTAPIGISVMFWPNAEICGAFMRPQD